MTFIKRLVQVIGSLCIMGSLVTSSASAAITDIDKVDEWGNDIAGWFDGSYDNFGFDNPWIDTVATWDVDFSLVSVPVGIAGLGFTHTLTATTTHAGGPALTTITPFPFRRANPPKPARRKVSMPHLASWDNQWSELKPTADPQGTFFSLWWHTPVQLAYNMDGRGAGDAVAVAYDPENDLLRLAANSVRVDSDSELFNGSYEISFEVVMALVDDTIDSVVSSDIYIIGSNGFFLAGGEVDWISYTPAGDPSGDVFGELGSSTEVGSILDTRGLTLEIAPDSFDLLINSIPLDALTLEFPNALDLREINFIGADTINFGAQFSVVPEPTSDGNFDGVVDGLDYLIWAGNFGDDVDYSPGPPSTFFGDYNFDGIVDGLDYLFWAETFGQGPNEGVTVPEPATCFGALVALVGLLAITRRRRV